MTHLQTIEGLVSSYAPEDVHILLRELQLASTPVEEKERLIQSGQRHYSEMISHEAPPSAIHQRLYEDALTQFGPRMAQEVESLARALGRACPGPIVLISLVRAGLPLGVLLLRALRHQKHAADHYAISIIRDRGIDQVALDTILHRHPDTPIIFVDGWTGKGAIAQELRTSLAGHPAFPSGPRLLVLADPCGQAWLAASADDWIIPSGILGATVSGLISRSIWPNDGGLHGCIRYTHLADHDVTATFIQHIEHHWGQAPDLGLAPWTAARKIQLQNAAQEVVTALAQRFSITRMNRIKPGIAEATRAVLRRVPEQVWIRDRTDPDVQLLVHLTEQAGLRAEEAGAALGPYRAVTLIRGMTE